MHASKGSEILGIDLRSLAVFRIAIAGVVLWDLADRATNLVAHYTDHGILPASLLPTLAGQGARLSIHSWASGSILAESLVFVAAAVAGVALLLGYRTRLATLVTWYLLVSVQVRNPWMSVMGGDKMLRLLLFWGLFLPLGARFSLDALRDSRLRSCANRIFSPATVALLLQLLLMYWITALRKNGPAWRDGEAVFLALHMDLFVTSFGVWLRQHGWLLPLGTWFTLFMEFVAPFFALSPWRTGWVRLATIAAFVAFHLSLAAGLSIGHFPAVSIAAWCAFLPRELWEDVLPRLTGRTASARGPEAPPLRFSRWAQGFAAVCGVYVLVFLAPQIPGLGIPALPATATTFGRVLRINQYWTMFAPEPARIDGWPEVVGERESGQPVDLLWGGTPSSGKPPLMIDAWGSVRWRLYYAQVLSARDDDPMRRIALEQLAGYYCRQEAAGAAPAQSLARVRILRVSEKTGQPGPLYRKELIDARCPDRPRTEHPTGDG